MAAFSDDCVFENTGPRPDGAAVRRSRRPCAASGSVGSRPIPTHSFEAEDIIVTGDRCVVRWVYRKLRNGEPWHLRGVDVFTCETAESTEKLAYTKG